MNRRFVIVPAVAFLAAVSIPALAAPRSHAINVKTFRGKIIRVVDGDTIKFLPSDAAPGDKPWSIRMLSTDTPETKLPVNGRIESQGYWGKEATAELADTVQADEMVEVDSYGTDKYNRVLGKIFKRNGDDANERMIASGWASLYVICESGQCDDEEEYRRACRDAVRNGRGIFDPSNPIPQLPFVFRAEKQGKPLSKWVGNIHTRQYVSPREYEKVPICERVFFLSEDDAQIAGYTRGH